MSIRLMSIVWDIPWPSQSALLVALKLADYANEEGGSIHPARETLAKHAQTSLATVKRILAGFRDVGLLKVVGEGGKGPRSTTRYEFDLRMLMRLHDGYDEIQRSEEAADKFVIIARSTGCGEEEAQGEPLKAVSGSLGKLRGSPAKISGSIDEPRNTTLEPPSRNTTCAHAREDSNFDLKSEVVNFAERISSAETVGDIDELWPEIKSRKRIYAPSDFAMLKRMANERVREIELMAAQRLTDRITGEASGG